MLTKLETLLAGSDRIDIQAARAVWREINDGKNRPLLTEPDGNVKIARNAVPTWSLNLQPTLHGSCPRSTAGCRAGCLRFAGRNGLDLATAARVRRSDFMVANPGAFLTLLSWEIDKIPTGHGLRLNALSDIRWELVAVDIVTNAAARGVVLYDYTKWPPAKRATAAGLIDLTYSASERMTDADITDLLNGGHRVAVVASLESRWWNHASAIDGDATDQRWSDPAGTLVVLKPKGKAKKDRTGFVRI